MRNIKEKIAKIIPDKIYLKIMYYRIFSKRLDLKHPKSFNEKLQWLKLYDRNPKYTELVDKYEVKSYVSEVIGEEFVIPTIGTWNSLEEIDFDTLPEQFVLKCTHDSGGVVIVKDKDKFDKLRDCKKLEGNLKKNFFYSGREWPYKNVKPRLIAEPYMTNGEQKELADYKLMCFNGKVKCSFVCTDRNSESGLKVTFFDKNWEVMPFERHYPKSTIMIKKPSSYEKMIELAEKLSAGIPFVRVDFYEIDDRPYFGELTFYPGGGFEEFNPEIWDEKLGDWIELPIRK